MRRNISSLLFVSIFGLNCFAGGAGGGSTEVTQLLNNTELVAQYGKQAAILANEVQQLSQAVHQSQMMLQNLQQLSPTQWNRFQSNALQLRDVVQKAEGLSFAGSNLDTQFSNNYPGYQKHYTSAGESSINSRTSTFSDQYKKMNETTRNSVNGSLKTLNAQYEDFEEDDKTMQLLQEQSQSADGQMKAIQASNEIALHMTEAIKNLQWTLMTQTNMQASWIAHQNEKDAAERALAERRRNVGETSKTPSKTMDDYFR